MVAEQLQQPLSHAVDPAAVTTGLVELVAEMEQ
jgi:hypothetical protein